PFERRRLGPLHGHRVGLLRAGVGLGVLEPAHGRVPTGSLSVTFRTPRAMTGTRETKVRSWARSPIASVSSSAVIGRSKRGDSMSKVSSTAWSYRTWQDRSVCCG